MSHHPQVIDDKAKADFCSSHGCGRYTTDWIPQMSVNTTVHRKTKEEHNKLNKKRNGE